MSVNIQMSPLIRFLFILVSVAILLMATSFFSAILSPVLLALFFAIILTPVYHWLQKKGVPGGLAMLIMIVTTIVIGIILMVFLFMSFAQLADSLSEYSDRLEDIKLSAQTWLASQGIDPSSLDVLDLFDPQQLAGWITGFLTSLGGLAVSALLVSIMIMFAMLDAAGLKARLAVGLGVDNPVLGRFNNFTNSLVRYIVARTLVNLITGTLVAVMLLIMGVDYAILWGVLTFFLSYIPYIGIFLATVPSVVLALVQYGPGAALLVILGVSIINLLAENLVAPKIIGQGLSISPFVVFLSFFFWSWLLGPLGMFLSMPVTVVVLFILESFDETKWLALAMSGGTPKIDPPPATKDKEKGKQTSSK